ncbi:uncharacterized protein LOC124909817 [Impatiens glandulifera]|uniref:uncharacterized protein LOC124909817 n=1 Tax=Impatiens glandulifera TaxID=253017 RepID=UPI001FB07B78|nr:uncharacterized protein LOC124909817 [Impatiens glandulifera]
MSTIVCGKRSSFFEELSSTPVSKRIRLSPLSHTGAEPGFESALKECNDDLDLAIKSLNDLMDLPRGKIEVKTQLQDSGNHVSSSKDPVIMNGTDWVDHFVREMMNASNMDAARIRASQALELFEKCVISRTTNQAAQTFQQENNLLKEQLEAIIYENRILKRAVNLQHKKHQEHEDSSQEMHHLKKILSQHQEQLRTLEVNNYALKMQLEQVQPNTSILNHFNRDIF